MKTQHRLVLVILLSAPGIFGPATATATDLSSTNYAIRWHAVDGGGGLATSANYVMTDTIGQSSAIGQSSSAGYVLKAGFQTPPDSDADLVRDFMDNCIFDPNTPQYDSNGDGFGNLCDGDLNNDLQINFIDLSLMKAAFFSTPAAPTWNPDADINGDSAVNFIDLSFIRLVFFGTPGPSGIAP